MKCKSKRSYPKSGLAKLYKNMGKLLLAFLIHGLEKPCIEIPRKKTREEN